MNRGVSASFRWPRGAKARAWPLEGPQIATLPLHGLDLADWLMLNHDDDRRTVLLEILLSSQLDPLGHDHPDWLRWRIRYDLTFEGYWVRMVSRAPRTRCRTRRALCWQLSIWTK